MSGRIDPGLAIGLGLLGLLAGGALGAPLIEAWRGIDGETIDLAARLVPPGPDHPLGTDELGRDLLARVLVAGRISLLIGLVGALSATVLGALAGLAAGQFGGRVDTVLMRLTDFLLALPLLPLLLVLSASRLADLGGATGDMLRILLLITLTGWTGTARLVRASVLSVRERPFVAAARLAGASGWRIMWVHLLPNAAGPLLVSATLSVGGVILTESLLSFLGLGIRPPTASWGNLLSGAQETLFAAPWLAVWPGLAIFLAVLAVNLIGDGLQRRLAP